MTGRGSVTTDHVVAGTGPRALESAPPAVRRRAVDATTDALSGLQAAHGDRLVVMSGMARGFDHLLATVALRLGVRLWAAVPGRTYGARYWRDWPQEFDRVLAAAWRVTHVMEDIHRASGIYLNGKHANFVRNDWMVATADEFLVWQSTPPSKGTAHCVAAIRAAGKPHRVLSEPAALPIPAGGRP